MSEIINTTGLFDLSMQSQIPQDTAVSLDDIAPGFLQAYQEQSTSPGEPWYQSVLRVMSGLIMTDQQRRLMNIQIERAKQGLPPLAADQYSPALNIGLSPSTQKLILGAVLGLGALYFITRRR